MARPMNSKIQSLALIAAGLFAVPAYAAVTCSSGTTVTCTDGISYTLTAGLPTLGADSKYPNDYVDDFTLNITNINDPAYSYGGKSGVQSFAFGELGSSPYFLDSTPPNGFTEKTGGLSSSGCNGAGAFFCFEANTTPSTTPALGNDSSLGFGFSLTGYSVADFANWNPGFKINWIGSGR